MQQSGEEMIAKGDTAGYDMRDTAYRTFGDIKGAADPKIVSGCLRQVRWWTAVRWGIFTPYCLLFAGETTVRGEYSLL